MICASTVDAEIKPSSALTESRGSWEPGRKRHGKWTAAGKVNGDKRPVSGPYACVKGRKCDGISAREDEQAVACLSTKVVPQGDFYALSFEQEDRAVLLQGGVIHGHSSFGADAAVA